MENKFIDWLSRFMAIAIVVVFVFGCIAFIISPIFSKRDYWEFIIYIRVMLVALVLATFAILRLYNSIVGHSRFTIELKKELTTLRKMLPTLEREIRMNTSVQNGMKNSVDSLEKHLKNELLNKDS